MELDYTNSGIFPAVASIRFKIKSTYFNGNTLLNVRTNVPPCMLDSLLTKRFGYQVKIESAEVLSIRDKAALSSGEITKTIFINEEERKIFGTGL